MKRLCFFSKGSCLEFSNTLDVALRILWEARLLERLLGLRIQALTQENNKIDIGKPPKTTKAL